MSTLTEIMIRRFCEHCDWSYQCWVFRSSLFDDNPDANHLKTPKHAHFFNRLQKILQEYWIHEVVKLNDPPEQSGSKNLTIRFVLENGSWPDDKKKNLSNLSIILADFSSKLRSARNKILSHKDLETLVSGETHGDFRVGDDGAYFKALQEFVNIVHEQYIGGPYPFDDLTKNDVEIFMAAFVAGAV